MRNEWVKRNKWIFVAGPLALVAFMAIFGEIVMHLWNWSPPPLFGWHTVSFWQAMGLLVLFRIFFGGFGGQGCGRSKGGRRMDERWAQMTPEERERLRQGWRGRCGGFAPAEGEGREPA